MSSRYDLDSRPPFVVLFASAVQHMGLMAVTLVFPLLVAKAAGADDSTRAQYVAFGMLAMGAATLLQAWGKPIFGLPRVGSGFLLPSVFTAAYLPAALAAAQSGGLGAVAGLTIVAGLTEIVLSRFIVRLRPYCPIEIVGLVVLLIGIILGILALKLMVGYGGDVPSPPDDIGGAMIALAVMVGCAIWAGPRVRTLAVLLGLIVGTVFHFAFEWEGVVQGITTVGWTAMPVWPLAVPSFEVGLLPGFLAGAVACTVRGFGDIVASQRANDLEWKRPDYSSVEAGVLADGIGTFIAGLIGTMGLSTYSASVGLSVATQVRARRVGIAVGIGWLCLGLFPGSSSAMLAIPENVLGAALLFASAFIVLSGTSILGQRLVDGRRTIAVGLGFIVGLSFDQMPALYAQHLPPALHAVLNSSLVLGLLTALILNALFRIGDRQSYRVSWQPTEGLPPLEAFLLDSGSQAGARADAVGRLVMLAEEFSQAAPELSARTPIAVSARFDEYVLDLSFTWQGRPLLPGPAPSLDPDADDEAAIDGIVLILMQRLADRLTQQHRPDGRHELTCRVDQ